jgi:hypothetical protein
VLFFAMIAQTLLLHPKYKCIASSLVLLWDGELIRFHDTFTLWVNLNPVNEDKLWKVMEIF